MKYYYTAQKMYKVYKQQEERLEQLKREIQETQNSVDRLKTEQDEFRTMLFDERDVPAFLDGISASAAKSFVIVADMKTQQFSEVSVPKDVTDGGVVGLVPNALFETSKPMFTSPVT